MIKKIPFIATLFDFKFLNKIMMRNVSKIIICIKNSINYNSSCDRFDCSINFFVNLKDILEFNL